MLLSLPRVSLTALQPLEFSSSCFFRKGAPSSLSSPYSDSYPFCPSSHHPHSGNTESCLGCSSLATRPHASQRSAPSGLFSAWRSPAPHPCFLSVAPRELHLLCPWTAHPSLLLSERAAAAAMVKACEGGEVSTEQQVSEWIGVQQIVSHSSREHQGCALLGSSGPVAWPQTWEASPCLRVVCHLGVHAGEMRG